MCKYSSCSIHNVHIPNGVTIIEDGTFKNCSLDSIVIPNSVTEIGNESFYNCSRLSCIKLSDSLTSIGDYAFYYCTRITTIEIPTSVTTLGDYAFYNTHLSTLKIPASVTTLGKRAFSNTFLSSVVIPKSITTIGEGCFVFCYILKEIQVDSENSNYQSVDGVLFNKDLTTLYCYPCGKEDKQYIVPNSVSTIDTTAFYRNSHIQTIQIPATTSRIGGNVFYYCSNLNTIEVAAENNHYKSVDGVLFDKELNTLYAYPIVKDGEEYTIPNSVTSIEETAFFKNATLVKITVPESVTNIGAGAFGYCNKLKDIELPNSLISIRERAFYQCENISNVKIPKSVTTINYWAFFGCSSLKSLEIQSPIVTIDSQAFYNCDSLTSVVCYAVVPVETKYTDIFGVNTYTFATLYVPEESIDTYRNSSYCWGKFQNIKPLSQYSDIQAVTLSGETTAPSEIYDLNGARVYKDLENLAPGIYVVRQGDKSHKVLIK